MTLNQGNSSVDRLPTAERTLSVYFSSMTGFWDISGPGEPYMLASLSSSSCNSVECNVWVNKSFLSVIDIQFTYNIITM